MDEVRSTIIGAFKVVHDLRHFVADRFGIFHAVFQFTPVEKK